jgi:hypothetical protein
MAINIKPVAQLSQKWVTRSQGASADYVAGASTAKTSQSAAAAASVATWQQAVNSPEAAKRFVANLNAAGDAAWQNGIKVKGAARYAPGVAAAQNKWASNVSPYLQALASLNLPPRGLRRSAQNLQRVAAVDQALAAVKTGGAA